MPPQLQIPDVAPKGPEATPTAVMKGAWPLRLFFGTVGRIQPRLGARLAESMFIRTTRRDPRPKELEFLARAEAFSCAVPGHRLQGYKWGEDGPLLLCVHGWDSHAGRFFSFADAAVRAGYRVVAFDAPGHGRSSGRAATMPEFAEAIGAVISKVGPVHGIVGHSLGGSATLLALGRGARAEYAAVVGAPADVTVWLLRFRDALSLPTALFKRLRHNLETRLGVRWEELSVPSLTSGLRARGLVIHDRDDVEVPWENGAALAASWPAAEFVTTHGLGHRQVMRDRAVIEQLIAFFGGANAMRSVQGSA